MRGTTRIAFIAAAAASALFPWRAQAQERPSVIDVGSYTITARIDPAAQSLEAKAVVVFTPESDRTLSAVFGLHALLNVTSVTDEQGRSLSASKSHEDHTVRIAFPEPLPKGKPVSLTFVYGGTLRGDDDSPVYGIQFAAIRAEGTYLLYPGRWFPVSGYTYDRYTMDLTVQLPDGYRAVSSGIELANGSTFTFKGNQPGFHGSLAVVKGDAQKINSQGVTTSIWFRGDAQQQAKAWGDEAGKVMTYLTSIFGVAPVANLTVVETGRNAPSGYSAPGLLFVSSNAASREPSQRLLANQIARQWFGNLVSPVNRNHIWLSNGPARYAEVLYQEHLNGKAVLEPEINDLFVDALTVTDAPVLQAARFEDYSPEFFAVTGSKGAATLHMLRGIMGDEKFVQLLKGVCDRFANQPMSTDDFRKIAEQLAGQNLQGFFIQWLESTGAPEFTLEYTVYRTQKGFRVMGKITQDLDTFRMPVNLRIETEGNPEDKTIEVVGPQTEFVVETFGKPRKVIVDPEGKVMRLNPGMRVGVAIRRGEQFAEIGAYNEALQEYQKALEVNRISSLAHYRVAEIFFQQGNYQSAANEFREALSGDLDPKWTEVWSHINLGKIFDVTTQRDRARNEYTQAIRTKDNTQGAQEEAAKYLKEPYQRTSRD